jgi:MSHA biogenesis protein MshJ
VKARLASLAGKLDALEVKERVLLLTAVALLLAMAWYSLGLEPLQLREQLLLSQRARQEARLAEIEAESVRIVAASRVDPDESVRAQLASAEQATADYAGEIRERAGELIAPEQMAAILKSVLEQTRGLEFVSLEGLGAEPLLPATADGTAPDGVEARAFRHGFRVRFDAGYLDTLAYLRALESLPWRFFWDAVELEVTAHPKARAAIVVYTLSLDARWIGV